MQIIHELAQWRQYRQNYSAMVSIGFAPTMGALHQGHISLLETSRRENDLTVASIFVNPTQFNQATDLQHYPRTLDKDLELLQQAEVDVCLLPDASAIYQDEYRFQLSENSFSQLMEGRHRPGHFNGVLTVVMKLLNLVKPTHAYFGEKDYQQYQLIHDMAKAFFMDTEIKACPTIREPSGLALSSRNMRLTADEHQLATKFAQIFHQTIPIDSIITEINALGIKIDYIEEQFNRRFAAVQIGDIRLIDNYLKE